MQEIEGLFWNFKMPLQGKVHSPLPGERKINLSLIEKSYRKQTLKYQCLYYNDLWILSWNSQMAFLKFHVELFRKPNFCSVLIFVFWGQISSWIMTKSQKLENFAVLKSHNNPPWKHQNICISKICFSCWLSGYDSGCSVMGGGGGSSKTKKNNVNFIQ